MSEQMLFCQKCNNDQLSPERKDDFGKIDDFHLNRGKMTAKDSSQCWKYKILNGDLFAFVEGKWKKVNKEDPSPEKIAFFCKCGYYSLDYKNFLKNYNNYNLINDNNKLKNELNKYKTENEQLKALVNKLKSEKDNLNIELTRTKKLISNYNNTGINQKQRIDNEINELKNIIINKDKEIERLKSQLNNNTNEKKSIDYNDIIAIHFISLDQKINFALKCLKTDTFAEVEEKLYQEYEEYRETNNNFISKGKMILRFKKICENNISDGDKIQLLNI